MDARPDRSLAGTVVGALALAVAVGASGVLSLDHLGAISAPGCNGISDCHAAMNSKWGSVPIVKWPVAFLGFAYYAAMFVAWLSSRGTPGAGVRWLARLGLLGSLFFIGVIFVEKLFCPYCIASHASNLVFVGASEVGARRLRPGSFGKGLIAALTVLVAATGALAIAESQTKEAARVKAEAALQESVAKMVRRSTPEQPASPAAKTPQPAAPAVAKQPPAPAPIVLPSVFTGRYRFGPEVAPIRVVMFTGYQCPDCRKMEPQVEELLRTRKDISISIKHFPFCPDCNRHAPTNMQPNGCWAARAAEAAGILKGVDGFKKMHEWLFSRAGSFTNDELTRVLGEFGWDVAEFTQTLQSPTTLRNVQTDVEEAVSLGLHYTPFVFINGVELKGWQAENSLKRAVEAVGDMHPEAMGPEGDHPPKAGDKFVGDWREQIAMAWPKRDPNVTLGPANARAKVTLFGDLLEPITAQADKTIRNAMVGRDDIWYEFRYFPVDKSCNPSLPRTLFPQACRAARAAQAAAVLGGRDAYWKMHDWIQANQKTFSDPAVKAAAAAMGLKPDEFMKAMDSEEVGKAVATDADIGKRIGIPEIPRIFVNGKLVPRWNLPNEFILERIIEEAAKPEPPK